MDPGKNRRKMHKVSFVTFTRHRRLRWTGCVARIEELIKGGVTSGKRPPLGSCSRSEKYQNITETGHYGVTWIQMDVDKVQWQGFCENGDEPSCSTKRKTWGVELLSTHGTNFPSSSLCRKLSNGTRPEFATRW